MTLLVLLVLPSAQIKLGASQLNGLIGSYTSGGHLWQVSYSSTGTTTWHTIGSDGTAQQGSRQWPATGSGDGFQDSTRLDGTTSGTVTATLTWVPYTGQDNTTDPPSSSVIVTESGSARWGGGGLGTGSADDGWGDPVQYAVSSGVHYEVKDGSSGTITITKSLSASTPPNTTPNAQGYFDRIGAFVAASLSVAGDSVTVTLAGASTDVDGSKKVLTGQGVAAQFSGLPSGYKVSSYIWSFTGGTPIKNWDPTWPNSTNPTQLVPLAPTDLSQTDTSGNGIPVADVSFYYTKAGSLTATCAVNFTSPDGKTGTVTVQSPSIIYIKPTATWIVNRSFNGMTPGFFAGYPYGPFGALELWGPIDITVPDPFAGGTGCIVQIATLDRGWARTPQNGMSPTYTKLSVLYKGGTTDMVKAPKGLDVGFPYPFGFNQNTNGSFTANNNSYTWQIGNKGFASDKPNQSYALSVSDGGGNAWYSSVASDHFSTWLMYQPPAVGGQPTIYVPLMTLTWSWGGGASLNTATNKWSASEGPPFIPGSASATDDYPSWNLSIPFGYTAGP